MYITYILFLYENNLILKILETLFILQVSVYIVLMGTTPFLDFAKVQRSSKVQFSTVFVLISILFL